jgi:ABC-2 type transport system ATP-binding protein
VLETVRHYAALYGKGADPAALVDTVGLTARSKATWKQLSGGERQRVSLALALAAVPDVVFLDEPTSGVDINGRDAVRSIIRDLAANGCAVVLATHELDEAERLADRMIIIDRGSLIADATLAELRKGHDEIRFRSAPELDRRALAEATGIVASKVGSDEYVIDAPPQPRLMAQLGDWLAEAGHPLHDLRAGGQRLEDVFRRLTGGDQS